MSGMAWTLFVLVAVVVTEALGQHSSNPNSLQAAIEALRRHHEILSSEHNRHQQLMHSPQANEFLLDENDYPYEDGTQQQEELNRALAGYLRREEEREHAPNQWAGYEEGEDEDLYGFDARKRSMAYQPRHDAPNKSVFRERGQHAYRNPDLGQDFLEEMEREQEIGEEEEYRHNMRLLWDKYRQQENAFERLLSDAQARAEEEENEQDNEDEEDKKKRSFGLDDRAKRYGFLPAYFGPAPLKRRDYPLLPWLDADRRKKRFPVAKRSAKPIPEEANASGTSSKVAKDLEALFGPTSSNVEEKEKVADPKALPSVGHEDHGHKIEKKNDHHDHEDSEEVEEDHEDGEHETDHEHDDHDESGEEGEDEVDHKKTHASEEDDKKKKRAAPHVEVKSSPEIVQEDQIIPGDLSDFKKKKNDVKWDKYFGYDRRKKKSVDYMNGKYASMIRQPVPTHVEHMEHMEEEEKRKKKQMNPEKLDSMDEKLKNIEDLIIEETVKYTGAHEGVSSPGEIRKLKDHVISRLATAYSLEKMRQALNRLRENVDAERHILHNEIEPLGRSFEEVMGEEDEDDEEKKKKKKKRIAVKKDQFPGENHGGHHVSLDEEEDDEDKKKKKKKRNGMNFEDEEPMDNTLFRHPMVMEAIPEFTTGHQCPMLHAMEKRCQSVDILSGDLHQELLPVCIVHQLCYVCGTSHTNCDLQYLNEAEAVCGNHRECENAARSALMILRGSPKPPQLGPRECANNSCLFNAIKDLTK